MKKSPENLFREWVTNRHLFLSLRICRESSEASDMIGVLFENYVVDILETQGDWLKIRSGRAEGYIRKNFVMTGSDAYDTAMSCLEFQVVVKPEKLEVKQENGEVIMKPDWNRGCRVYNRICR